MVPERLGRPFRWLMGAAWLSNLGDGIAIAAGPLLVASQTDSPMLVASAALLQRLPFLLFGLWAGALADRLDRRRIVMIANAIRVVVVAVLCAAILGGWVSIAVVLATMFLYGVSEVFADTTSGTLLPALVPRGQLSTATHRLQTGFLTCNNLVGPPIGAFLFALGAVFPFATQVVLVAAAIALVSRISHHPSPEGAPGLNAHRIAPSSAKITDDDGAASPPATATAPDADILAANTIRRDILEGLAWMLRNPPVRTLALIILTFNVTWAASWSVLVLWSREHLGMSEVQFGLLTTASAIGGLIGTTAFSRLERRFSVVAIMRVCLSLEVGMHLALANTGTAWLAMTIMFGFGIYAFIWGTISMTTRQRAVPQRLQGRVGSVNMICVIGGMVVGQALGGVIAEVWGLTAPFWFAFVGAGITLALVWRQIPKIASAEAVE